MAKPHCKLVARAVRACEGVGLAACGDNNLIEGVFLIACGDGKAVVSLGYGADLFVHHLRTRRIVPQRIYNINSLFADRENTSAALGLKADAKRLKEGHSVLGGKGRECGVEKSWVLGYVFKKLLASAIVGNVAATLACNGKLFAESVGGFENRHLCTREHSSSCRHHSCSTAANNSNFYSIKIIIVLHKPHIHPKVFRGPRIFR